MRKNFKKYLAVLLAAALCLTAMVGMVAQAEGEVVYQQVTDVADILDGGEFVIAAKYNDKYYAMDSSMQTKKIDPKEVTVADGKVTGTFPVWTLESVGTGVSMLGQWGYVQYNKDTDFVNATNKETIAWEWQIEAKDGGLFQIYWQGETDKVVLGFRDNIKDGGSILKFGPFPMQSVESSTNIFVLELVFFEKTVATETPAPTPTPGPSIDDTADINTAPLYAVLVLGLAVVAFASKKRFAK